MAEETAAVGASSSRQEFERDIIARARGDAAFRAELLADPRAAIKKTYGVELPPSIELRVVEETPSVFYLVLPLQGEELTDEQLAAVAGGTGLATVFPKFSVGGGFDKDLQGFTPRYELPGSTAAAGLAGFPKV